MKEKAVAMKPNIDAIKAHLEFITSGMGDYSDGFLQIAYGQRHPNQAENFALSEMADAADFAFRLNSEGNNVYINGAIMLPTIEPQSRSNKGLVYATNVIWCDLDAYIEPEELKKRYAALPPTATVVTGRSPQRRVHLWWKLAEPVSEVFEIEEMLRGVITCMGGDESTKDASRLMRLAGTIAWPVKKDRVKELTEFHQIKGVPVYAERLLDTYKPAIVNNTFSHVQDNAPIVTTAIGLQPAVITDGRDLYMSKMVYASILNLTRELKRWPTPDEVLHDAWPIYSRKVGTRHAQGLDAEGRGQKLMRHKITSKLGSFTRGAMRGWPTIESVIGSKSQVSAENLGYDPDTGEIIEENTDIAKPISEAKQGDARKIHYILAKDIKPSLDANDFVQGLLGNSQLSVVYGESNCGKTFFMTDLAFHVAQGKEWRGRRVEQGGVLYVALEGSYGLKNRIAAYCRDNLILQNNMPFAMVTTPINFFDPNGNIDDFIACIPEAVKDIGHVKLVVVDTLARALMGGDENSGQDMSMLVGHADKIRLATGAHVCFVHHSGKDRAKGARGHSSLRAAVDTEIEISREPEAKYSTIKTVKQREMEMGEDMYFGLKKVELGKNRYEEEVTSCVVTVVEKSDVEHTLVREKQLTANQQFLYDAIVNQMIDTGTFRVVKTDMPKVKCITFQELRDRLEQEGFKELFDGEKDKVKSATQTTRIQLKKLGKINFDKGYIWLTE